MTTEQDPALSAYAEQRARKIAENNAALTAVTPEFIRLAGELGADFELPIHTSEQFAVALRGIGGHNNYDVEKTIAALGPLVPEAMAVKISDFTGGPALNFEIPYYPHQRIAERHNYSGMGTKYTDDERIARAQHLINLGRKLRADDIRTYQNPHTESPVRGKPGPHPYRVRLWWD